MSRTPDPRKVEKGLTLIELLISAMIVSAMLGAVWMVYSTSLKVFYGQHSRQNIKSQASYTFYNMTKELYQALSVTAATTTSLTVTMDFNGNGVNETVQYVWSGTIGAPLNRIEGTQTTALIRSVDNPIPLSSNPLFTYYGANNVALGATPVVSQIRLIAIDLYTTSGSETFHLRTKVQLKCI